MLLTMDYDSKYTEPCSPCLAYIIRGSGDNMKLIKRWAGVGTDPTTTPRLGLASGKIVVATWEITHNWFLYTNNIHKTEPLARIKERDTWSLFGFSFPQAFQGEWLCRDVESVGAI